MKILLAPDKFKDALDAPGVARAMARGLRDADPRAEIRLRPLADGGEGTGPLLARALGARPRSRTVLDPRGRTRRATWWLAGDPPRLAIVEMAQASGLQTLPPRLRNPLATSTFGTGQLLRAAIEAGARSILLTVGGSATVDGGAGCLQALGFELLAGRRVIRKVATNATLARITALRPPSDIDRLRRVRLRVLCDVDNPLLGRRGAAPVFAPQKGARSGQIPTIAANLAHWADLLLEATGRRVHTLAGGGAAGGLPAGLWAALGATLASGFDEVATRLRLRRDLAWADLVITGEGRLDTQTAAGKVVAGVARLAADCHTPVVALVGALGSARPAALARKLGLDRVVVVTPPGTRLARALTDTAANLRRCAAELLAAGGPWSRT